MELNEPSAKYLVQGALQQTEIGPLPLDWQVEPLAKVAEIRSGIAKNVNAVIADAIEVPYLRVANVQDGYLDLQEISTIRINREDLRRYSVLPFDVLMNEGGDIDKLGRGALWRGQIQPCVHQNHVFVVRCKPALAPQFLSAWSASPPARRYFLFAGKQTTNLASINKTSLGQLPVAMPRLREEQERIAQALTDIDALIESLELLLAKKRKVKQGAMQELLSRQLRLSGFEGEWIKVAFGDIAEPRRERVIPAQIAGTTLCVELEHIQPGTGCLQGVAFESKQSAIKTVFSKGDVLFGKLRAYLRKYWIAEFSGVCSTEIWALKPRGKLGSNSYLFYLVQQEKFIEAASSAYGTHMPRSDWNVVSALRIEIPESVEEQNAVATVLSDMDTEITALEARLTKARQIKQGMAEALLTGRIRLV